MIERRGGDDMDFTATVIGITRATEGFGDSLRTVGLKAEMEYQVLDEYTGDTMTRRSSVDLPFSMRSKIGVGDKIQFSVKPTGLLDPAFAPTSE
jgi:hypothetical protein